MVNRSQALAQKMVNSIWYWHKSDKQYQALAKNA